jgi:hypothetical protein
VLEHVGVKMADPKRELAPERISIVGKGSRSDAANAVRSVMRFVPKDWIEASNADPKPLNVREVETYGSTHAHFSEWGRGTPARS